MFYHSEKNTHKPLCLKTETADAVSSLSTGGETSEWKLYPQAPRDLSLLQGHSWEQEICSSLRFQGTLAPVSLPLRPLPTVLLWLPILD